MNHTCRFIVICVTTATSLCVATADPTNAPAAAPTPAMAVTNATVAGDQANTNMTVITSTQLRMDTDRKIAYFDGNVLVIDPQFQLRSNRLIVFLNPSGAGMERAEAYDDVVIVQEKEKRKARSQKAVFTPVDGKIVLTGEPQLENERGITKGQTIIIYQNDKTFSVEGGTRTILDLSTPASTNAVPAAANTNEPANDAAPTNVPPQSGTN